MLLKHCFTLFRIISIIDLILLQVEFANNHLAKTVNSSELLLATENEAHLTKLPNKSNKKCADIFLQNESKPAITLYDKSLVNRDQFNFIRSGKLQNASYSVIYNGDDAFGCRLEICGYSTKQNEWGNCRRFQGKGTLRLAVFWVRMLKSSIVLSPLINNRT